MTASAHVRVIEEQADDNGLDPESQEPESPGPGSLQIRTGGFHVTAVPIDQPFGE